MPHILPARPVPGLDSRRAFLTRVAGGLAALLGPLPLLRASLASGSPQEPAAPGARPTGWALLSDTHIHASLRETNQGQNMAANLLRVSSELVGEGCRSVLINGDLARTSGEPGDYESVLKLLVPLRAAGASIHLTLGNHDHRDNFLRAAGAEAAKPEASVAGKYCTQLTVDGHRWLLLDSLEKVNEVPGFLREAQLGWIERALDLDRTTPTLIFVHHNVEAVAMGLQDTAALLDLIKPRRQVKAVFFGHTHVWKRWTVDGIHFVNLPAVGYAFGRGEPLGWVRATPGAGGLTLELRSLDGAHPEHRKPIELAWRPGEAGERP